MDLSFAGVQGRQKALDNTKTLMKIDVSLCLVVQEPGVYLVCACEAACRCEPHGARYGPASARVLRAKMWRVILV